MSKYTKLIGRGLLNFLSSPETNDPVVRLFQVEYNKEYRSLQASGVRIDRALALEHMERL